MIDKLPKNEKEIYNFYCEKNNFPDDLKKHEKYIKSTLNYLIFRTNILQRIALDNAIKSISKAFKKNKEKNNA